MRLPVLQFLHHHVWRHLPRRGRRAVLLRGAALLAPRNTPGARATAPVIIVGALRSASGLGEAARACHDALADAGVPVFGIDLTAELMYQPDYPDFVFEDGRGLAGHGTLLLHVSGPLVPLAMLRLGHKLVRDKHVIAHWFWELPRMPDDWSLGVSFVHEICVNTRFVAEAVRPIAGGRPVHVVPYPLSLTNTFPGSQACKTVNRADRLFTVLVVFNIASNFTRKNPCAAVEAFRRAFGDDWASRLIVKYSNASAWPEGVALLQQAAGGAANIFLRGEMLSAAGMEALYDEADVVLSLHRAEGFGLVVAEAMLRGLPAIATDWSGNTDFLTPEVGIPVGYRLVPVHDPQGNYLVRDALWAEADIGMAAKALKRLCADAVMRQELGAAAAAQAARLFDPRRYASSIQEIVYEL